MEGLLETSPSPVISSAPLVLEALEAPDCMMPVEPEHYPVVLKPATNLYGMSWQAHVLRDREDFERHWGHTGMWMPLCRGAHHSLDLVVSGGEVQWWTAFETRWVLM